VCGGILQVKFSEAGKAGPIAWQMHNKGLFDEYNDVRVEVNPTNDDLITTKKGRTAHTQGCEYRH
jgi:hypothetical protein